MKAVISNISSSGTLKEKIHSQKKSLSKDRNIQTQTELIEKQKWEIENFKAAQTTGVSPQQLVTAISQAMSCLHVGDKKMSSSNTNRGNKFMWHPETPKPSAKVDGSLDSNLMCQYCKDTWHELENCKWLQNKSASKCGAT